MPVPAGDEMPAEQLEAAIAAALAEAQARGIEGSASPPSCSAGSPSKTGGASLKANVALLENNAAVAAQIAVALNSQSPDPHTAEGRSAR